MPAMPRKDKVELRLTTLEKADWVMAAGGTRLLSQWIRAVCNAEAESTRPKTYEPGDPFAVLEEPLLPEITALAQEQAHRDTRPLPASQKPRDVSSGRKAVSVGVPVDVSAPSPQSSDCSRWMHHRPGVYCGTCKKVTPK